MLLHSQAQGALQAIYGLQSTQRIRLCIARACRENRCVVPATCLPEEPLSVWLTAQRWFANEFGSLVEVSVLAPAEDGVCS